MLQSLAYSNFTCARPHPIDPAVFFDLVKVRRLVEDATDLAVRAANGTTSSAMNNSINASNSIYGAGGAAALGLGIGSGGVNAKLSKERKHRMRELATQKLSHAYQLDEIAASVATMQSASSLEEVAKLVLQRNVNDCDAKYVHFFHEKIPSRMLAQSTSLRALDEIVQERPTEAAPLRTRAVTKLFKDDFVGAARDLTDGLAISRYMSSHIVRGRQLELAKDERSVGKKPGDYRDSKYELKIEDEDQPKSLEPQLLFHRAGVFLTLACQTARALLDGTKSATELSRSIPSLNEPQTPQTRDSYKWQLEVRKMVKTYAKRALRDYISFLSNFEYTPGLSGDVIEDFYYKASISVDEDELPKGYLGNRFVAMPENPSLSSGQVSSALIPHRHKGDESYGTQGFPNGMMYPNIPSPKIHVVSALFSSSPLPNLPPYPVLSQALVPKTQPSVRPLNEFGGHGRVNINQQEVVTYHPLLTDALHSLLLCHCLIQTSPKEHLRHAYMAARLARICDGYPIFLAARSPSRADWMEVVRQTNNWLGLQQTWDALCAPAPLPGQAESAKKEETEEQAKDRRRQEAIMEALADERVHDEASFQASVAARERRAEEQQKDDTEQRGGNSPKRWAQEDGKEYPISTERAELIVRWIKEAPRTTEGGSKPKRSAKKGKNRKTAGQDPTSNKPGQQFSGDDQDPHCADGVSLDSTLD